MYSVFILDFLRSALSFKGNLVFGDLIKDTESSGKTISFSGALVLELRIMRFRLINSCSARVTEYVSFA
jgi:hypothetical protein